MIVTRYKNVQVKGIFTQAQPAISQFIDIPFDAKYMKITRVTYLADLSGAAAPPAVYELKTDLISEVLCCISVWNIGTTSGLDRMAGDTFSLTQPVRNTFRFAFNNVDGTDGIAVDTTIVFSMNLEFS